MNMGQMLKQTKKYCTEDRDFSAVPENYVFGTLKKIR
jgi:hypothetical protein